MLPVSTLRLISISYFSLKTLLHLSESLCISLLYYNHGFILLPFSYSLQFASLQIFLLIHCASESFIYIYIYNFCTVKDLSSHSNFTLPKKMEESPCGIVANVLDCNITIVKVQTLIVLVYSLKGDCTFGVMVKALDC